MYLVDILSHYRTHSQYVGEGNVDIGVTGIDIVEENSPVEVQRIMDLGFGKCSLCVQAPVISNITDVKMLAGKRIVTSFPNLTKKYFDVLVQELGVETKIRFVSGSVEAACGLGLADAVVDLVETGTTMKVCLLRFSAKNTIECVYSKNNSIRVQYISNHCNIIITYRRLD